MISANYWDQKIDLYQKFSCEYSSSSQSSGQVFQTLKISNASWITRLGTTSELMYLPPKY